MITKSTIDQVYETARVEEVIGDFVSLKKAGSNFKGLSPFSQERSPSFMVSPVKQIWKDFSSGKGGNVVAFELKGGITAGRTFLNNIKMCSLSANLGDTRTIVTHPASTTHGRLSEEDRLEVGITAGLVRVSVGLENVNDIINDLKQALEDA